MTKPGERSYNLRMVTGSPAAKSQQADMAELADAPDLGSGVYRRAGSSPVIRMKWRELEPDKWFRFRAICVFSGVKLSL